METSEDGRKLHMKGNHGCKECGFATVYEYGQRIYYCDHEGRVDDMGKLGAGELYEESPGWCPLREIKCKND